LAVEKRSRRTLGKRRSAAKRTA